MLYCPQARRATFSERTDCYAPSVHRADAPLVQAGLYTGSIGEFRYRFNNDAKENVIHAAVYSKLCYELAADVAEQDFPWDDDGVEALKAWYQSQYEKFLVAHEA